LEWPYALRGCVKEETGGKEKERQVSTDPELRKESQCGPRQSGTVVIPVTGRPWQNERGGHCWTEKAY
jgi:hypothetical protein